MIINTIRKGGEKALDDLISGDLVSISIPGDVTSIGDSAFSYCAGLTDITIPNSVTTIDSYAFYSCGGLTNATIGGGG